jgi:hypothetical protein
MAEEVVFKLKFDTGNSAKDLEAADRALKSVKKEVKETSDAIGGSDMQARFDELKKRIDSGGMSVREYGKAIKDLQGIALQAGRTSPVGQAAIAEAAKMTDKVKDLRNEINRTANDGKNMQAALQLGSTVVAGYGVAQGAMALLGNESEDLQKSLVKLQAITATLNGLEQIRAALEKESFLMMKAKATATTLLTAATGAYATVVGSSTGALKIFRIALASTGIGAIVVALGLLIANFDAVREAVEKLGRKLVEAYHWFQDLGMGVKIAISIMFPLIGVINGIMWALEQVGVVESKEEMAQRKRREAQIARHKARIKELQGEIDAINESIKAHKAAADETIKRYEREIELIAAAGGDTTEAEKIKLAAVRDSLAEQIKLLEQRHAKERELMEETLKLAQASDNYLLKGIAKNEETLRKNTTKAQQEEIKGLKDNLDQAEHAIDVHNKKTETKRREAGKKAVEDRAAQEKALRDLTIANITDTYTREKAAEQARYDDAIKAAKGNKAMLEQLEIQHNQNMDKIRADEQARRDAEMARQKEIEKELEAVNRQIQKQEMDAMLERARLAKEEADLKVRLKQEEAARIQAIRESDIANTKAGFETIAALAAAFAGKSEKAQKRAFDIQKAANIGVAVMDTMVSAQKAYASQMTLSPDSPIRAAIASGIAVASGLARVATIARQQFNAPSVSGGGGAGIPSLSTTQGGSTNPQQGTETATAGLVGGGTVSVVEIMNVQGRVNKVTERATIN